METFVIICLVSYRIFFFTLKWHAHKTLANLFALVMELDYCMSNFDGALKFLCITRPVFILSGKHKRSSK